MTENQQNDLFWRTPEAVIRRLPAEVSVLFAPLLNDPLVPAKQVVEESAEYLAELEECRHQNEFLDIHTARRIDAGIQALYKRIENEDVSDNQRLMAQAAARYFILNEDAEGDTTSVAGFDDDAEVFNAVAQALGYEDLVIEI